ncbi:MAG: NADP-dependent malic enzyme [Bacilli bacterium]|jgi:malate dehydrogenase (oxaloacetate-decarboxylating)|nr:NADP-dependent malic enzyme [Bacilli bacterium]
MNINEEAIKLHRKLNGKIEIKLKEAIDSPEKLSLLYSPGVAQPCLEIAEDPQKAYEYTFKKNTILIVSDGSAVLGLGNIKGLASLPVMEGKAALFKQFGDVNCLPIVLDTQDTEEIITTIKNIAIGFGGINLEDISTPRCFEIEKRLDEMLDIPVFHDDQHGTAIVCCAGLINALKVVDKKINEVEIVINGLGSAGIAITKLLVNYGFKNFSLCDINGLLYQGTLMEHDLDNLVDFINEKKQLPGLPLQEVLKDKDVFIGVSAANLIDDKVAKSMNKDAIIFAMANPNPEISFENAQKAGVKILATGRSDYPNQINNVLVFPGIFKGTLAVQAQSINTQMKIAAVNALASIIKDEELKADYIIPSPFDKRVVDTISQAVQVAAIKSNINKI